ncbi:MAG TPA: MBL fold metallo-hydrolase, partial [Povalibacter sp.]|nr:MBL fold metallo-hydrolase [Povalibacter sp.]
MRVTFLGHQGWQFEHDGRCFLLDPILEHMGNGAARLPVWPGRRLNLAEFEPLDAVIISHEHADHFSLETLAALPRRVSVLIPDLASSAMADAITECGFAVERFRALGSFTLCGIRITALPGLYNTLEPDTYALLMQDSSGASFLTAIDTVPHPDIFAWLAQHCPRRTLDNLTNNFVEPRQPLVDDANAWTRSRGIVAGQMLEFVQKFSPRRAVISGQGWSFGEGREHLNHTFFSVDNRWLATIAQELAPHVEWFEGLPGMRFTLHADRLQMEQSNVIGPVERVSREFRPQSLRRAEPFAPWSMVREISAERV